MYKRLNITLPEDVLSRADAFAARERYTRSGLIATALDAFVDGGREAPDSGIDSLAAEAGVAYAVRSTAVSSEMVPGRAVVKALLRTFFSARDDIEAAWLFGSVARDEAVGHSDVDVAVLPCENVTDEDSWRVEFDLAARLSGALGVERVDATLVPCADPLLAHRALVEGVRVFGESSTRAAELEIRAAGEYFDSDRLRRTLDARLGERVRRRG